MLFRYTCIYSIYVYTYMYMYIYTYTCTYTDICKYSVSVTIPLVIIETTNVPGLLGFGSGRYLLLLGQLLVELLPSGARPGCSSKAHMSLLGCSGDLLSRLSSGPYGAPYGYHVGLMGLLVAIMGY